MEKSEVNGGDQGDHTKSNITKRSALRFGCLAALQALVSNPII
jgi:hypothetical protein